MVNVGDHRVDIREQFSTSFGTLQGCGRVRLQFVLPCWAGVGTVVDRAVMGNGLRVNVDDAVSEVVDGQATVTGQRANDRRLDVPLVDDLEETFLIFGGHDRHHAFLRLGHQDFACGQGRVTQQHVLKVDVHTRIAIGGQLGGGARNTSGAEVLDALNDVRFEQVEAAFDEDLLHEGVTNLHGGALGGHAVFEGFGRQNRCATDAVTAGARAEEDNQVAFTGCVCQVNVVVTQGTDAECIDQRVALVGRVKFSFTTDIRQAEAVAVATHAGNHTVNDARGIRVVNRAET